MSQKAEMRKLLAALGAEHRLRQRFETIDWEEEVRNPMLEEAKQAITRGENIEIKLLERPGV